MAQRLSTKEEYQKQVNIIIEYITNNLGEELDLTILAEKANFSPFHFHRIMKAFLGEPLGTFIVRLKVETAARLLRYTDLPVQDIAYRLGYDVPSSLSKAFKLFYNISPIEFRNNKNYTIMKPLSLSGKLELKAPKIGDVGIENIIYIQLTGEYASLDFCGAWNKLWNYVKENDLFSEGMEHLCFYYDDPRITESNKLRTDVCLTIHKQALAKGEVGAKQIGGGRYAVFHYVGAYENLGQVYDTIFRSWLPDSGYKMRDTPVYEKYLNNPNNTPSDKLETEIYVPVE